MLSDEGKTKEQVISKLTELRQQVAEFEILESGLKWAEQTLRESEEKYQQLFDLSSDALFLIEVDTGEILDLNNAAMEMYGYSREEALQMNNTDFSAEPEKTRRATMTATEYIPVCYHRKKDGSVFPTEISVSYFTWYGKEVCLAAMRDITERKRAEEALRESEQKFKNLFQLLNDIAIVQDSHGKILDINQRAEELVGYSRDEFLQMNMAQFFSESQFERMEREFQQLVKIGHVRLESEAKRKDGTLFDIDLSSRVVDEEKGIVQTIIRDITARKQAEEALRESEERYRALVNLGGKVGEAVVMLQDTEQGNATQTFVSDEWPHITGYSRKELLGMSFFDLVHPEHRQASLERHGEKMRGAIMPGLFEMSIIRKDGTEVPIELTSAYTTYKGERANVAFIRDITERKEVEDALKETRKRFIDIVNSLPQTVYELDEKGNLTFANRQGTLAFGYTLEDVRKELNCIELFIPEDKDRVIEDMRRVLSGKKIGGSEYTALRKDGSTFPAIVYGSAITRENKPVGMRGVIIDVTELKQAEEREKELQQELALSSRLASIGELAAGVAHEINNPLTGVIGFSERLMKKSTSQEISQDLERIHNEARRAARVVENLLTFARRRGPKKECLDINEILGRTLELRAYELKSGNIDLAVELAPSLPETVGDFGQIQQVFLNIILNAEQAMTEADREGKLTIKTQRGKDCIRISFADDGPGIPVENLSRVFDPFFTTRGDRGGTGLGLSACHGIVTEHGGKIYAESKPGQGVTFFIELPLAGEEVDKSKIAGEEPVRRG